MDIEDSTPRVTAFAITGVRSSRVSSKKYRPTYYNELAPIYEDISQGYYHASSSGRRNADSSGSFSDPIEKNDNFDNPAFRRHDYEDIDILSNIRPENQLNKSRHLSFPKRYKSRSNMFHDIMNNRLNLHRNSEPHILYGRVKHVNKSSSDTAHVTKTNDVSGEEKSEVNEEITDKITRVNSLYTGNPGGNVMKIQYLDPQLIGTPFDTTREFRYMKPEPEPTKDPPYLCPAGRKIKKRCFAFCFVLFLGISILLLIVVIEGWATPSESGKKPVTGVWTGNLLKNAPTFNNSDVDT